jgi:hypothetical protein
MGGIRQWNETGVDPCIRYGPLLDRTEVSGGPDEMLNSKGDGNRVTSAAKRLPINFSSAVVRTFALHIKENSSQSLLA